MFYKKIKILCKKKGVSVRELESSLEFSRGCVCKWDTSIPSFDKVVKLADYFNVPIDEFRECIA